MKEARMDVAIRGHKRCDEAGPIGRNHLLAVPASFVQHQLTYPCHISCSETHGIFSEAALGLVLFLLFIGLVILHANRNCEVSLYGFINAVTSELLKGDAGSIEVPVVVDEISAG